MSSVFKTIRKGKLRLLYPFIVVLVLIAACGGRQDGKEKIVIRTELGDIHVSIDLRKAPVTSANFLKYVDAHLYDSACFYRLVQPGNQPADSVRIEVIQGGRYKRAAERGFPPIAHETTVTTGILHRDGTVSMARSQPGTATSEFFICVGDQPELDFGGKRNPDGQGFAAFGEVTSGMDVVRKIHSIDIQGQYLEKPVIITEIIREGR
ncbi:MAG TPA: peptidylprolyl isomerase [Bacteroidales bacterium]|nr:peptidylprolyl isomerase [Bacteroidales bacterium]HOS71457.1 peptidylprolyl isomerase [Bacteroidales bacterium]HQH23685.1 peptidylprolyl isomerase [Bacteroidales bacterium]HQJ82310.1 peptidylprolyl isomerase [Bacteroidales bacterium]